MQITFIVCSNKNYKYTSDCIETCLSQTYKRNNTILVLNGKKGKHFYKKISKKFSKANVKVYYTEIEQLSFSLNYAMLMASSQLIARIDADDLNKQNRLEKQLHFLESNKLDLCGSFLELIDQKGVVIGYRKYPSGPKINALLAFKNCFAHNTILFRKKIILQNRGYCGGFNTEDYDLWRRLQQTKIKWDNLNEYLVQYRVHRESCQLSPRSYAECASIALREFLLQKTTPNLLGCFAHVFRSLFFKKNY